MDFKQLEQLGDELRGIGHKRRQLVEQIFQEVKEGDQQSSKELYKELAVFPTKRLALSNIKKNYLIKK